MKNKLFIIILTLIIVILPSCVDFGGDKTEDGGMVNNTTGSYVPYTTAPYVTQSTSVGEYSTSEPSVIPSVFEYMPTTEQPEPTVTTRGEISEPTVSENEPSETIPEEPETSAVPETSSVPVTSAPPATTQPVTTTETTTVELDIELPEANGTMLVDKSPSNEYISAVVEKRKIDPGLLAAVYSIPESGQNYVLEFTGKTGRTKNDLRRVYLLDGSCNITSVAAAKNGEKEGIGSTENWFCFNVLIKGVIFDAISDKL